MCKKSTRIFRFPKLINWFFVVFVLVMSPCGLAFKAGFAKIDITPKKGEKMLLVGGGEGLVDSIGDPLYVKAIVLSDGERHVALVSVDLIDLRESDFLM